MENLSNELINLIVALDVLSQKEILDLACCSQRLFSCILGTEWALAKVQALNGLEWCCQFGNLLSVKFCLQDPECHPEDNNSDCLKFAALTCEEKVALLLKDGRADPAADGSKCFEIAAANNPNALALLLQDGRGDPESQDFKSLYAAIRSQPKSVEMLLNHPRFNPDPSQHKFVLPNAARYNAECLEVLLRDQTFDPSEESFYCFYKAISNNIESIKLLLQDGRADPSDNAQMTLLVAIEKDPKSLCLLLQDGRALKNMKFVQLVTHALQKNTDSLRVLLDYEGFDLTDSEKRLVLLQSTAFKESYKILIQDGRFFQNYKNHQSIVETLEG